MATINSVAVAVVDAAGQAGGIDEVTRIARNGWRGDVVVAELPARKYEDHDDCLSAALSDVAEEMGLEGWELSAGWDSAETREAIIVRSEAKALRDAIQAEAARVVGEA